MVHPANFIYAGMDIHRETHSVCVLDCFGQPLWENTINNEQKDFVKLHQKVEKIAKGKNLNVVFGLEDTSGSGLLLAHYLAKQGCYIKTINPVLADRLRRKTTHPEKSDTLDAKGVAKVLIREGIDTLPDYKISQSSQLAKELRELNNDRNYLVSEQTRIKNQLHALLSLTYGKEYKVLFKNPFSQKALRYFIENPLSKQIIKNGFPYSIEVAGNRIRRKANRLFALISEIKEVEKEQADVVAKTDQQIETLPGCGLVTAAAVLAEVKDINRFDSSAALAKYAGLSPRQKSSGKSFHHQKTYSGNRRLNAAFHRIALSQIGRRGSDTAKEYYLRKVSEGKTKKQAITCLKRKLCDIVYLMLKKQEAYNYPSKKLLT